MNQFSIFNFFVNSELNSFFIFFKDVLQPILLVLLGSFITYCYQCYLKNKELKSTAKISAQYIGIILKQQKKDLCGAAERFLKNIYKDEGEIPELKKVFLNPFAGSVKQESIEKMCLYKKFQKQKDFILALEILLEADMFYKDFFLAIEKFNESLKSENVEKIIEHENSEIQSEYVKAIESLFSIMQCRHEQAKEMNKQAINKLNNLYKNVFKDEIFDKNTFNLEEADS